jgi:hypothetical protein
MKFFNTIKQFCRENYSQITGVAFYYNVLAVILDTFVFRSGFWYNAIWISALILCIMSIACYLINNQGR